MPTRTTRGGPNVYERKKGATTLGGGEGLSHTNYIDYGGKDFRRDDPNSPERTKKQEEKLPQPAEGLLVSVRFIEFQSGTQWYQY